MTTVSMFCNQCRKKVQPDENRCPDCGLRLRFEKEQNHFLSGPLMTKTTGFSLNPGTKLMDRFKIKDPTDNGRFSTVYLAEDTVGLMEVALKVVEVGPLGNEHAESVLQREMILRRNVSDFRHIIKTYDIHFVPWGGTALLLLPMEYANGGTFRKWLWQHREDLETRRTLGMDYFKQACHGVGVSHDAQIINLDLKPENLLFLDGILKVSDFGSASFKGFLQELNGFNCEIPPAEMSTPIYMSPEQFIAPNTDRLSARADIYSLGIILFELIHPKGSPPFEGSYNQLRDSHIKLSPPVIPEAGDKLTYIIDRCLKKDPADRYQSVWDLLDDLEGRDSCEAHIPLGKLEETWEKASVSFFQGDLSRATKLTEEVLRIQPDHIQAKQLQEELRERFAQAEHFYQDISQGLEGLDLDELARLIREAVSIYPDHPSGYLIQTRLLARTEQYRDAMEKGKAALKRRNWESALGWLRRAQQIHKGGTELERLIEILTQIKDKRSRITQTLAQKKLKEALHLSRIVDVLTQEIENSVPALRE